MAMVFASVQNEVTTETSCPAISPRDEANAHARVNTFQSQ